MFRGQPFEGIGRGISPQAHGGDLGELDAPLGVGATCLIQLAAGLELFPRESPDRFEHRVAWSGRMVELSEETRVHQRRYAIDRIGGSIRRPRDRLNCRQGEPADEDTEAAEQRLIVRRQEVVAPGDGVAHGALAVVAIPGAAGQQAQPVVQARQDDLGRQGADPVGGELDRQGQTVQAADDVGDDRRVVGGQGKARIGRAAPVGQRVRSHRTSATWVRSLVAFAAGIGSGATGTTCSPERRSTTRLVARMVRFGQAGRRRASDGPASTTCSRLSRTSNRRRSSIVSASWSTGDSPTIARGSSDWMIVGITSAGSRIAWSVTRQRPSGNVRPDSRRRQGQGSSCRLRQDRSG